jgi:hypothetical protein
MGEHQRVLGEYGHDRQVDDHDDERNGGPHRLLVAHPRLPGQGEKVQGHRRNHTSEAPVGAEESYGASPKQQIPPADWLPSAGEL